jgi:hypothetical protein
MMTFMKLRRKLLDVLIFNLYLPRKEFDTVPQMHKEATQSKAQFFACR